MARSHKRSGKSTAAQSVRNRTGKRVLRCEPLESRRLLALFSVNSFLDSVDVNPGDGLALDATGATSLRAAMMEANALAGADQIQLAAGTYRLTLTGSYEAAARTGDLDVTDDVEILGGGAGSTVIDATGLGDRIFDLPTGTSPTAPRNFALRDLTIRGGQAKGSGTSIIEDYGGGLRIDFYNAVTIENCVLADNSVARMWGTSPRGVGGAISSSGNVTILNSTVQNNSAGGHGGAIYVGGSGARTTIRNSTFANNSAAGGGAIHNHALLTVEDSTFVGNSANPAYGGDGGVLNNNGGGNATLTNVTFSGNTASMGGVVMNYCTAKLVNCTLTGNSAEYGGGLYLSSSSTQLPVVTTLENTIVAGNTASTSGPDAYGQVTSLGHNLVGNTAGSTGFGTAGDLLNVDPRLGPLADNGGPTSTHALASDSPAVDAANSAAAPATDQRGVARPQGYVADIGAYELRQDIGNRIPDAVDDTATTEQGSPVTVVVLANDKDLDGDPLIVTQVSDPASGTVTLSQNGSVFYTPNAGFVGTDRFTYTISDGQGGVDTATVTIMVLPPNTPPVAVDDRYSIKEDNLLTVPASGVLANDTDAEGDTRTVILVAGPSHGTLSLNINGSFTYRPAFNYNGTDSFTYKLNDGRADSAPATVEITVLPVDDPPVAHTDSYSTDEDTTLVVPARGVLANDTDPEGSPITAVLYSNPLHGTVTLAPDGSFVYVPNANYNGTDDFAYRAFDGVNYSGYWTSVFITVRAINDAPVAANDAYTVNEDQPLTVTGQGLYQLMMVSDPGDWVGQGKTYAYNNLTGDFTAWRNFDNGVNLFYRDDLAPGDYWGLEFAAPYDAVLTSGTYTGATRWSFQAAGVPGLDVSGQGRGSNTLTGQFTVQVAEYNPDGSVLSYVADFEQHSDGASPALRGTIRYNDTRQSPVGVLQNDTDVEGNALRSILVSGPSHGTLFLSGIGTFTYKPDPNFNGTDSFTYKANDGLADSNIATVTITVQAVNDPPVAQNQSFATDEDTAKPITLTVADVEGSPLTYTVLTQPVHGTLSGTAPNLVYTPAANFYGADSFTFRVNDGTADSNIATVSIGVRAVNDPPVAYDQQLTTAEDAPQPIVLSGSDVENRPLSFTVTTSPAHGTLSGSGANLVYTPAKDFYGTDSFTFRANDGSLNSNEATVAITISSVNDPPTAIAGEDLSASEAVLVTFDGSQSFDPDNDSLTYTWDFGDGETAVGPTPTHVFADNGVYTVYLTVDDGQGETANDTLVVTVANVAPSADLDGPASGVWGQSRLFTFTASDGSPRDQEGTFTYSINWGDGTTQVETGSASLQVEHTFTGTSASAKTYTVSVTATDKDGGTSAPASRDILLQAASLESGNLYVGGTTLDDTILVTPVDTSGRLTVTVNGTSQGSFLPTGWIYVYALSGNDDVQLQSEKVGKVRASINVPAILYGDSGSDSLSTTGSVKNNILLGGAGNDTLRCGGGRDLLFGGLGADLLYGGDGEDVLVGGTSAYDANLTALQSIWAEWSRTDADCLTRIGHLKGTLNGGLNSSYRLNSTTVFDDGAVDQLYGQGGADWFLFHASATAKDSLRDKKRGEEATGL